MKVAEILEWRREHALAMAGHDPQGLAALLLLLCQTTTEQLAALREALAAGAPNKAIVATHSIKGAAASLGVERLRRQAAVMEESARQGELELVAAALPELVKLIGLLPELS